MTNIKPLRNAFNRSKIEKAFLSIVFVIAVQFCFAQTIRTSQNAGPWNQASTWVGGVIPTVLNSTSIVINHAVTVPNGFSVSVDSVLINAGGTLTIANGGTLTLLDNGIAAQADLTVNGGSLQVSGLLIGSNASTFSGTTTVNTSFLAGSEYRHQHSSHTSVIPTALWDQASTLNVNSITTAGTVHTSWNQTFGNVTINLPSLAGPLNFAGLLRDVRGDLNIVSCNNKLLLMTNSTAFTIAIGGSWNISAAQIPIQFSASGATATYTIGGNFVYQSTVASNLANLGPAILNITGNFVLNSSPSTTNFVLSTGGSAHDGTINLTGNMTLTSGVLNELNSGTGRGIVNFVGVNATHVFTRGASGGLPLASAVQGQINWIVPVNNTLDLGTSVLSSGQNSLTTINGRLRVGSTHSSGALQNSTSAGNVQTPTGVGLRTFASGSTIIYGGTSAQILGSGHPQTAGIHTIIDNAAGVTQFAGTSINITGNLTADNGTFTTATSSGTTTVTGNLSLDGGNIAVAANSTLILNGNSTNDPANYISVTPTSNITVGGTGAFGTFPFEPAGAPVLNNLTLTRGGSGSVTIDNVASLEIEGTLTLTNGNLLIDNNTLILDGIYGVGAGALSANGSTIIVEGADNSGSLIFLPAGNALNVLTVDKQAGTQVAVGSGISIASSLNLFGGILGNSGGITIGNGAVVTRDSDSELFVAGLTNAGGESYDLVYTGGDPFTTGLELPLPANTDDLYNLTINGGPVTLDQNITINGVVSLDGGGLTMASGTITMNGSAWLTNGGTFSSGTGEVLFTSVTFIDGAAVPQFGNIEIGSAANVTVPITETNISGDINVITGGVLNSSGTLVLNGTTDQNLAMNGTTIYNLTVNKVGGTVFLTSALNLSGLLNIISGNSDVDSGPGTGNLTILSSADDDFGVQAIGIAPIPSSSSVIGNVTVQRFMSGEGRIWRYISSPITNGSVGGLQDDFPITGTFADPSTGPGINSSAPSFYLYNEAPGGPDLQVGWTAYPTSGSAIANPLEPGRGYSAFIREAALATTWELNGPINQGTVELPVSFTSSGNGAVDGWNLVGNPYPCTIFWGADPDGAGPGQADGWLRTAISESITIRENSLGDENFLVWDGEIGDFSGNIAIGQAFWVKATGPGAPQLEVSEAAKSFTNGNFFKQSNFDYIQVVLTKGTSKDRAYIRQRDNSLQELDHYDAPKMANSYYSLSIMTADNQRLAISAVPEILCGGHVLLDLRFAKNANGTFVKSPSGEYKLFANQFGLYGSNQVQLLDKFTNTTHTFQPDQPYTFTITSAAQSYRTDRFELIINERVPSTTLTLSGAGVACEEPAAAIVIQGAQQDVEYQAFINGVAVSEFFSGEDKDLNVMIPNEKLALGNNVISVKASNGCSTYDMANTFVVQKDNIHTAATVTSSQVCQEGQVTLTATGAPEDSKYLWFNNSSEDALHESSTGEFVTGTLQGPTVFYVAVKNALGCVGPKSSVKANVIKFADAEIESEVVNELKSNYPMGNTWYLNDVELPDKGQVIHISESGRYKVEVVVEGCITSAEMDYVVTGDETEVVEEGSVRVYPNPVQDYFLVAGNIDANSIRLLSTTGVQLKLQYIGVENDAHKFWIGDLNAGMYYVAIADARARMVVKIIKR